MCALLQSRFDNSAKRDSNSKAMMRLQFEKFLAVSNASVHQAFNEIVLRIEKHSAIATSDLQTKRAKITALMSTLERTPWFIQDTAGVEYLKEFSSVVQKVSHELKKMTLHDPSMAGNTEDNGRDRIHRGILYGSDSDFAECKSDVDN